MRTLPRPQLIRADQPGAGNAPPESTLTDTMERLAVAVFVCEFNPADGIVILRYHNRQLPELLGMDSDDLVLDPSASLRIVHRDDLDRLRGLLTEATPEGVEHKMEVRIWRAEEIRWIEVRAMLRVEENLSYMVSGCCWDITARKVREQAAVENASSPGGGHLGLASQLLPIGFVVTAADDNVTITDWNPAAEKIFGYSRAEAIGKSVLDLIVLRENRDFVRQAVRPTPDASQARAADGRNVRKDGSVIWCRWFNTPICDANGVFVETIAMVQDVTEQLQNEQRMRLWASVIQQSTEAILICDTAKNILLVNRAFEEITGFTEAEAVGKTPRILSSGRQGAEFYAQMWQSVARIGQWHGEIWNRRKNGELFVEWLALSAVHDTAGAVTHYIGIFSDITQRKQTEERVQHLAHFDALTDLPNRSLLIDRTSQLLAAVKRSGEKIALLFIDLDRFKNINDSMGHEAGDELLKTVAQRLLQLVRGSDTVARMGGDEFVIALSGVENVGIAALIAEKVLAAINAPMILCDQELCVSASIGICVFPDDALDVSAMIRNADAAMYRAKASGRNAYQFYTRDMNERALEILATETALRHALQREEFVLHYQPQICIHSGAVVGAEALIRWNRPGMGMVMPGQFIPIAEERGLIAAIGQWTLREACRQAAAWDREGAAPLPIAVNLSASEFHQVGFVDRVGQTIRSHGLRPERIELEITEGVIVRDAKATIDILRGLYDQGVRLSIDDFGTGYSSLNYLRRFPLHKIKIDQSFVREMLADRGAAGIVHGIVGLARSLQLEVLAEGVETAEQLDFLRVAQCDFVQGYLFSRGLPPQDFQNLVAQWPVVAGKYL